MVDMVRSRRLWNPCRKYLTYMRVRFLTLKEYSFSFVGDLVTLPIRVAVTLLVWSAICGFTGDIGPYTLKKMLAYQLLIQAIMSGTGAVYAVNYHVWSDINHGDLSLYLARPIDYQLARLCTEIGNVFLPLCSQLMAFLIAAMYLGLPVAVDPHTWMLFAISLCMGFVVAYHLQFLIGSLTFWTEAIFGFRDLIVTGSLLLSGGLIPITLMPTTLRCLSTALPFQATLYTPASLLLDGLGASEVYRLLAIQASWLIGFTVLSRIVWALGVRRYEAQGG